MPDDLTGNTFTISNLGMMGIHDFCAVINPPNACILAVAATEKKPVFCENSENNLRWVSAMRVTLSGDHRVIDGAVAAQWLNRFKYYVEDPMRMLV